MNQKTAFKRNLLPDLKKRCFIILSVFSIILLAMSSSALAEVSNYTITPENPGPGDTVTIIGTADPGEEIPAAVSFEKVQQVSNGEFVYDIGKVTIPDDSESFSFRAEGVTDLSLSVKFFGISVPIPDSLISINNGVATFGTSKLTSGTYDITISGTSSEENVNLIFGAKAVITADDNGNFEYSYTTNNMPEGAFDVNLGGRTTELTLGTSSSDGSSSDGDSSSNGDDSDSSSSSSSSGRSSSSSHTGTEYKIVTPDNKESGGVGDDMTATVGTSEVSDTSDSLESTSDSNYQEGYVMTDQTSATEDLPILQTAGLIVGAFCVIAIFLGYRKNKFK